MGKLHKACRNYGAWKTTHAPEHKPWLYPEQNSLPHLNPADIGRYAGLDFLVIVTDVENMEGTVF